jgi:hypothetical protein
VTEQWRAIPLGLVWTESHYEVSDHGQVRNRETGRILATYPSRSHNGDYQKVNLWKNGIRYARYVHRLVAEKARGQSLR